MGVRLTHANQTYKRHRLRPVPLCWTRSKPEDVYTETAGEYGSAMKKLGWYADLRASTPDRPQSNCIVERAVRRVKEGTRCALVQSGFHVEWPAEAMSSVCFL